MTFPSCCCQEFERRHLLGCHTPQGPQLLQCRPVSKIIRHAMGVKFAQSNGSTTTSRNHMSKRNLNRSIAFLAYMSPSLRISSLACFLLVSISILKPFITSRCKKANCRPISRHSGASKLPLFVGLLTTIKASPFDPFFSHYLSLSYNATL